MSVKAGQLHDGRADQYALACLSYQCLVGEVPFPADEPSAVMFAHVSADPPRASARNPALSMRLDDVIARALAKEPAHRYPDCATFLHALSVATSDATSRSPRLSPDNPLISMPADSPATLNWPPRPALPAAPVTASVPDPQPSGRRISPLTATGLAVLILAIPIGLAALLATTLPDGPDTSARSKGPMITAIPIPVHDTFDDSFVVVSPRARMGAGFMRFGTARLLWSTQVARP